MNVELNFTKMKRLKLHALLIVAILAVSTAFAQKVAIGPLLYDQISSASTATTPNGMYSYVAVDSANLAKTTFSADDFTVPVGETWDIAYINALGVINKYSASSDVDTVNVIIYENDPVLNKPSATEVYSATDISTIMYRGNGDFYVELPTVATLAAGTYWLCVQPVRNHATDGYWKWEAQTIGANGASFYFKNPLHGFSYDANDWTSGADLMSYWSVFDLSFALHGPRLDNDLAFVDLISPVSGGNLAQENVTIQIENPGLLAQTGFDVRYKIGSGAWVTETVTATIAAGQLLEYTFTAAADLSEVATHSIVAEIVLPADGNVANNSETFEVTNFGNVFLMGTFTDIATCSGGFTDPGGPAGNWNGAHDHVATIYPDTQDARVRLIFKEFDNGWGEFYIYDGVDINAPVIDLTPDNPNTEYAFDIEIMDTVTASNSAGALTIAWSIGSGSKPGWYADISCWMPPADDFAVTDLHLSIPTIYAGESVQVSATVYNAGLTSQAKDVTFTINGTVYETVTTTAIAASESTTVTVNWTPQDGGAYVLQASVPADGGEVDNNTMSKIVSVYADGDLIESFEGETFPPEFWSRTDGQFFRSPDEGQQFIHGNFFAFSFGQDTLVTPRLIISEGDQLEFLAFSSMWWFTTLDIVYSATPNGPWTHIANVPINPEMNYFQEFSVDISAAAGNNYIGFASGAPDMPGYAVSTNIDFVRGPQIFYYDHNVTVSSLKGDVSPMQNDNVSFTMNVKNNGLVGLEANAYTVKLMMADTIQGDQELVAVSGAALASKDAMQYTFSYAFDEIGFAKLYGMVEYAADMDMDDNITRPLDIFVQALGTDTIHVGSATDYTFQGYPFNGSSNSEVTQTMYMDYEVGSIGTITGLTYFYKNGEDSDIAPLPIQIFVAETTDSNLTGGLRSSEQFTRVFNSTVSFEASAEGELFFPFEIPYVYNGGNLIVFVYREQSESGGQVLFKIADGQIPNRSARIQYISGAVDLTDADFMNAHYSLSISSKLPNTVFHKNESGIGQIEGVVLNENSQGAENVTVSLMGTSAITTTNEFGQFQFLVAPEGEHQLKITNFGYRDIIDTIEVVSGALTSLNYNLELKPEVVVSGTVLTSDGNTPVANLDVSIRGYKNYTVATNADGYFEFSNVYANEAYSIFINLEYYAMYTSEFDAPEGIAINLGNITLEEIKEPSFMVQASQASGSVELSWNKPYAGISDSISLFDEPGIYTGYAADLNEEVWMGNIFEIGQNATLTGIDMIIYDWADGGYTAGEVTLEIFDMNEDLVMTQPFTIPKAVDEAIYPLHVDIPDVTVSGGFYVMVHWEGLNFSTPLVAFDRGNANNVAPNLAMYKYAGQAFAPLSELVDMEGVFEIGVKVKLANGKSDFVQPKAQEGYNVYRLSTSDIHNPAAWAKLNTEPIVSSAASVSYTDNTWSSEGDGFYSYVVETIYTEGVSVPTYSATVANGIYSQVAINVTTNTGESAEGARIKLVNNNGNSTYAYTAIASVNGAASFENVRRGTYTLSIAHFGFTDFSDGSVVIANPTETFNHELIEYIINPSELAVVVDNASQTATLTWKFGSTTEYILDDGTFENGLALSPDADAYLGNYFEVTETGSIVEFMLHGEANEGSAGNTVTIEVFDASGNSLGVTDSFEIPADKWERVPVQGIQFSGAFYAMVHWNASGNTNFLSIDNNGPNTNAGYYYDVSYGFLPITDLGTAPGAFLLRVVANVGDKKVTMSSQRPEQAHNVNLADMQLQKSNRQGDASSTKSVKSFVGYNVYLNDMVTPIATNVEAKEYVFTSDDLPENGTHTAAVSSLYTSGESELVSAEFTISFVSIADGNLSERVNVYPNPARSEIFVQNAENARVVMYSLSGTILFNIENFDGSSLDISTLDAGVYIIQIVNEQEVCNKKIEIIR